VQSFVANLVNAGPPVGHGSIRESDGKCPLIEPGTHHRTLLRLTPVASVCPTLISGAKHSAGHRPCFLHVCGNQTLKVGRRRDGKLTHRTRLQAGLCSLGERCLATLTCGRIKFAHRFWWMNQGEAGGKGSQAVVAWSAVAGLEKCSWGAAALTSFRVAEKRVQRLGDEFRVVRKAVERLGNGSTCRVKSVGRGRDDSRCFLGERERSMRYSGLRLPGQVTHRCFVDL